MVISKEVPLIRLVAEMIEDNRDKGADRKYLNFLIGVHGSCCLDKTFAECLEVCLKFSSGAFPTIEEVERALARKDGGIRPLLEDKGIIEPRKEGKDGDE